MSNFSYDDFAVLVRKFNPEMLSPESLKSLRIVPLSTAPSMADAIKGTPLEGLDSELNLPKQKNGAVVRSNVTVQHDSAGYCRLVGHIEAVKPQEVQGVPVTTAKAFVLYHLIKDESAVGGEKPEVIAVASLKEGFAIGDVCYPSFTITTVNNYQSVAFNPNAFATVEDLKNINGLDGLHIAFDTASGDLKLLDKDGNVLDQANLPIKADVIIADGEEGYKYVKTDVAQDIHAAKAWMPAGATAWKEVLEARYEMKHAALVVGSSRVFVPTKSENVSYPISTQSVQLEHVVIDGSTYMVVDKTEKSCHLFRVKGDAGIPTYYDVPFSNGKVTITNEGATEHPQRDVNYGSVDVGVITIDNIRYVLGETENSGDSRYRAIPTDSGVNNYVYGRIETPKDSSTGGVVGITLDSMTMYTFEEGATTPPEFKDISGRDVTWFGTKAIPEGYTLKYGLEAFVWTVKGKEVEISDPFFQQLNTSLLDLGFHEGDDIALGERIGALSEKLNGVDADEYMHGKDTKATREQEVDDQRAFAKDELVAWNAQHPKLDHDGLNGTRISKDGLDVRNGKIEIGNGVANDTDEQHKEDNVKRYVIETDIDVVGDVARADTGLQIGVIDSLSENGTEPIQKDILTINAEDYISGAPTCLALLKCHKDPNGLTADLTETPDGEGGPVNVGRITANFTAAGAEGDDGVFTLTITDNRANNGFGNAPRIVEIIPVYKSGADAQEAVPAQRSISAIADADTNTKKTLSIPCSQVIDWAQSIDLGGTVGTTSDDPDATQVPPGSGNYVKPNGMELYLIVKVY